MSAGDAGKEELVRVWRDGRPVEPPAVSPLDRAVTLGLGVFETVRLYGATAFRLERHLARLREGAGRLGIPVPADLLERVTDSLAAVAMESARVRITLTGGEADEPGSGHALIVRIHPWSPVPRWYEDGISGVEVSVPRSGGGLTEGAKSTSRAESVAAIREVRAAGADEGLWRDARGRWVEGTASNLFVVAGGRLRTPPLSAGCLAGVTREAVMELAPELGLTVTEEVLEPGAFDGAEEAFITSSLREVVPLVRVNGDPVGPGAPGPVWRRVAAGYRLLVEEECGA